MNYFDENIGGVVTETVLKMRGLPTDVSFLASICIYPMRYPYPSYNSDLYSIEPSGDPEPATDGKAYVQAFKVVPLRLDEAKQNVKVSVTSKRWIVETGGIVLTDGTQVLTGKDDQNRVASALRGVEEAGISEVDFKAGNGWVRLTTAQLKTVGGAIAKHVQACFSRECALHKAIDAAQTVADLEKIDINAGWPNNLQPSETGGIA